MTLIIGYINKKDNKLYMGCDSSLFYSHNNSIMTKSNKWPKVFKTIVNINNSKDYYEMLIGTCGYPRINQLLRYSLIIPEIDIDEDINRWLISKFIPSVRNCFIKEGYTDSDNTEINNGSKFMVGFKDRLFIIEQNFQITEIENNYCTMGGGSSTAFPILKSIDSILNINKINVKDRIIKTFKLTEEMYTCCRPPYYIEEINYNK